MTYIPSHGLSDLPSVASDCVENGLFLQVLNWGNNTNPGTPPSMP